MNQSGNKRSDPALPGAQLHRTQTINPLTIRKGIKKETIKVE